MTRLKGLKGERSGGDGANRSGGEGKGRRRRFEAVQVDPGSCLLSQVCDWGLAALPFLILSCCKKVEDIARKIRFNFFES